MGEDNAETERRVGRILLDHTDVEIRLAALGEEGEQHAGRAGTDNTDTHGVGLVSVATVVIRCAAAGLGSAAPSVAKQMPGLPPA